MVFQGAEWYLDLDFEARAPIVLGDGGHNGNDDGVILPDALRWLWRPRDG